MIFEIRCSLNVTRKSIQGVSFAVVDVDGTKMLWKTP